MFGHQLFLPVPDIDRTSYFLVFGGNPMASNGSLMTVPDFPSRLRELKARGGRMVVFDPRRTETAKVADEHHFVRPGSDAFVLLAMLQVLFAEALATAPAYADGLDAVEAAVRGVHAGARRGAQRGARRRDPPGRPRVRRRRRRRRLRPGRRLDAPSSGRSASGRSTCSTSSPATSTAVGRRDVHLAGDRRGRHRADRPRAPRPAGTAASAGCRSSAASCRWRRSARRSRRPARARSGRC